MEDDPEDPEMDRVEEEENEVDRREDNLKTYEIPMKRKFTFFPSKNVVKTPSKNVKTTVSKSKNNVVKTAESGLKEVELDSGVKTTESNVDITGAESGFKEDKKIFRGVTSSKLIKNGKWSTEGSKNLVIKKKWKKNLKTKPTKKIGRKT